MATWQATFWIVPKSCTAAPDAAWATIEMPRNWEEYCAAILPSGPHWDSESKLWGQLDSHAIEASFDQHRLEALRVRLDLRDPAADAIALNIVGLARTLNAEFCAAGATLRVPAEVTAFAAALEGSPAMRFVNNPTLFFRRLEIGGVDDA